MKARNTIIAGNNAPNTPDFKGSVNSQGHNLVGKSDGSSGFTATGDQTGTSATPLDPTNKNPVVVASFSDTDPNTSVKDLTEDEVMKLREAVENRNSCPP